MCQVNWGKHNKDTQEGNGSERKDEKGIKGPKVKERRRRPSVSMEVKVTATVRNV